jgi:hypothetical protein
MNVLGCSVTSPPPPGPRPVMRAGDFTGDGLSDVLMQADSGQIWEWNMAGNVIITSGSIGNPGLLWHAFGIGDFTGIGKDDPDAERFSVAASSSVGNPARPGMSPPRSSPPTVSHEEERMRARLGRFGGLAAPIALIRIGSRLVACFGYIFRGEPGPASPESSGWPGSVAFLIYCSLLRAAKGI